MAIYFIPKVKSKVTQSRPTLCHPTDYSLLGSPVHGIFQARENPMKMGKKKMGCHFLLKGIFPTQGLNLGLQLCRQTLYHQSHQEAHSSVFICQSPKPDLSLPLSPSNHRVCPLCLWAYGWYIYIYIYFPIYFY